MGRSLLFGTVASSALIIGALIGIHWRLPKRLLAIILSFAGGALLAALSFQLFEESFRRAGAVPAGIGLLVGASFYIILDAALLKRFRRQATGLALVAAAVLDGLPENLALGTTLVAGGGSVALLVAIFVSNLPEGLGGSAEMRRLGFSKGRTLLIWLVTAIVLVPAVLLGQIVLNDAPAAATAAVLAFAAGAIIAALADTVMPEAYDEGGPWVAFATVAGFFVSFMLNTLD